jgi:hypothetical protein
MPIIPIFGRWWQEEHNLGASLDYIAKRKKKAPPNPYPMTVSFEV